MKYAILAAIALCLAAPATAQQARLLDLAAPRTIQQWPGSDPARQPTLSTPPDIDFAIAELCFPFILSSVEPRPLINRPGVGELETSPQVLRGGEVTHVAIIGHVEEMQVTLSEKEGARICGVIAYTDNEVSIYSAANHRLQQWPLTLDELTAPNLTAALDPQTTTAFCGVREDGGIDLITTTQPIDASGERSPGIALIIMRGPQHPLLSCELPPGS